MNYGAVPPAGVGLLAGLLTTAGAVALSATGLLPVWMTTPLLVLAGGLAAGLAAPVRPTIGALLGAATGVFAGVLQAVVAVLLWTPVPNQYITPPPLLLIALLGVIFSVPVYAVAGAVGAAVRPLMPRPFAVERVQSPTPERRQLIGIAAGALIIVVAFGLSTVASRAGLYLNGMPSPCSSWSQDSQAGSRRESSRPAGRVQGPARASSPASSASVPSRSTSSCRPRQER